MENTTTHPRIVPLVLSPPRVSKKAIYVIAYSSFGVFSITAGIISIILLLNGILSAPAGGLWLQICYELSLGALMLAGARALVKGKLLSIWLYGGSVIGDGLYHLILGYPLNYLFLVFGVVLIWQLLKYRSELGLV
jgi:hypothetical protein